MTKEKLVDYVMTTPNNPNLAVLNSLIDKHDKNILDKAGSVKTVNSIAPDEQGNVVIAYDDLENKPFYSENILEDFYLGSDYDEDYDDYIGITKLTFTPEWNGDVGEYYAYSDLDEVMDRPIANSSYVIEFDGIAYEYQTTSDLIGSWHYIGNPAIRNEDAEDNGLPFLLCAVGYITEPDWYIYTQTEGEHTIQIWKKKGENIKPLDPKYLPETTLPEYLALEIPENAHIEDYTLIDVYYPLVRKIGVRAFLNCFSLITADFPLATLVDEFAFFGCSSLTTAVLPNITSIEGHVFHDCSSLTTANFPNATSIDEYAFFNCSKLTSANFPAVTSIGSLAFQGCSKLTTIKFPAATSIENSFISCSALTTVDLPVITSIGSAAFASCTSLKSLILRNGTMATLSQTDALAGTAIMNGTGYIYAPSALIDSYKAAENWSTYADQFRALEDYTVDGTITGDLDESKINATA